MASTVTALTSGGGIALSGDTSGNLSLQTANGTYTATVPQANGSVMVSGNMPAFSATRTTTQTIGNSTWTKLQFNSEVFDTNSCYDPTTNYRFTPNVSGYYQVNWLIITNSFSSSTPELICAIYKNGTNHTWSSNQTVSPNHYNAVNGSDLIYLNGSTDYIEAYVYQNNGGNLDVFMGISTYPSRFSASLVRAA